MASKRDQASENLIRIEGRTDGLIVRFTNPRIVTEAEVQQVGRELLDVATTAERVDMPIIVSFRGVQSISSALVGKLVILNKKVKAAGQALQFCDVPDTVAEVFRRISPGDGSAGSLAVLIRPPSDDSGHAVP